MGNNCRTISLSSAPVAATKNDVDLMLEQAQEEEKLNFKVLLLGAGESGKSTVVKQIKLIWKAGGGLTQREKTDYTTAIRKNVIEVMQTLLEAVAALKIDLHSDIARGYCAEITSLDTNRAVLTAELASKVSALWADTGVKEAFSRRNEFWCLDATPYYLDEAERLADPDYEPTEEDIIMTRVRTTGIVVTQIPEPPYTYHVVDVGGQRSERRKWINCFDDVKAIIFLEGLSGYNQVLFEDSSCNRMHESLSLFADIVKNPIFKKTPIFIFLNKKDLFEEMIPKTSLKVCFPEYDGPDGQVLPAVEYIKKKYEAIMAEHCPGKHVYIHVIAARLRMDMKVAFGEVKEELKKLYAPKKK